MESRTTLVVEGFDHEGGLPALPPGQLLHNADLLAEAIRAREAFTLLHTPMLSTVCFQHTPPGLPLERLDEHNERLAQAMQRDGRVYIAAAQVDGRTRLRACSVNYRTTPQAVDLVLEVAAQLGRS